MIAKRFPTELSQEEREEILNFLEDRFGIERTLFENYLFLKGTTNYWMFPKTEHLPNLKKLIPEVVGLLFLRKVSKYLKPTSAFLQRFGKYATKNVVTLNEAQLLALKEKMPLKIDLPISPGYVILRDESWILGCGLYLPGKLYAFFEEKLMKNLTPSPFIEKE